MEPDLEQAGQSVGGLTESTLAVVMLHVPAGKFYLVDAS